MQKIRIGLLLEDCEYEKRFTSCLMKHYQEQFELHMFTDAAVVNTSYAAVDGLVVSGPKEFYQSLIGQIPIIVLHDEEEMDEEQEGEIMFVDKYQEVNKIVDEILKHIGEEIRDVQQGRSIRHKLQTLAVYSLSQNEYQLPFAVTLASILSEKEKVLMLDLQENSGLSQLLGESKDSGLEELMVMAEGDKYSRGRILACIDHFDTIDVVYPVCNTECLCEAQSDTYYKLLHILSREMGYTTIIMNMGSRFVGFFDILADCDDVYFMRSRGSLGQWREKEFRLELEKHMKTDMRSHIRAIEIPCVSPQIISCQRLVEQWKWNELGDCLRSMTPGVMSVG